MITRDLLAAAALLTFGSAAARAEAPAPQVVDISQAFVDFWDRTQNLDPDARLAEFKKQVAPLYPGFYSARGGRSQEKWDAAVKKQIAEFPAIRARYLAAQKAFPTTYQAGIAHFRRFFPKSQVQVTVYLLHSLGEMDGGTRTIGGKNVLIFGADGIARYHQPDDVGPFFDHELFHVEHAQYFQECEQVWCGLWIEGLATAAAGVMNPGATPRMLMLELPRPIPAAVEANWREALCRLSAKAESTSKDDYTFLFLGNGGDERLPPRWGYYVGYRLAQRVLQRHSLQSLAHMRSGPASKLVRAELAAMVGEAGGCG